MILILSQATSPITADPVQWTALAAVIAIALAFVYTAVKWPSDAKAERTEMTKAFAMMLDANHTESEKERQRMSLVIERVCGSFDNAVSEMRKCREEDREACAAFSRATRT